MCKLPSIDMIKTGQKIRELRIQRGMSVKDLQKVFGFVTPQAIYKWQHGTALPSIDNLVILAMVFQVTVDEVLVLDSHE
ncbi:MAG: helix-turn-helix domain-containing protein [Eubacterium sp.]